MSNSGNGGSRQRTAPLLPILAFLYIAFLMLLPLSVLVFNAFGNVGATFAAIGSTSAIEALARTILLTAIALVVNLVLGIVLALVLTRDSFPGRAVLGWLTDLPLAMSPVTIGLAFFTVVGRGGWFNPVLDRLGIDIVFALPGMILVTLFVTFPFAARETALVLEEIGTSEEEAAATLGANSWQTFVHVTLPNILPGVVSGAALLVARALGEFGAVLVIGGAISGVTDTATTFIFQAVEERQLSAAYGMSMVLIALSMAAFATFTTLKNKVRG